LFQLTGRITKVLNMKPNEILGMVEEAAGTRMYETKRVAAIKTIEKKQMKVDELNAVLAEEITPTLERLRGEKQNYLKWSKNNADIERIERFVIANEYSKANKALEHNVEGVTEMRQQMEDYQRKASEGREKLKEKEAEIEERSIRLAEEYGDRLKSTKLMEEKLAKELVKHTSAWQNSQKVVKSAEDDLRSANQLALETREIVNAKSAQIAHESERINFAKKEASEAEAFYEQLKSDYQNISAGIASSQGDSAGTLPQQIAKAMADSKIAEGKAQQAKMKIDHLSKSLEVGKNFSQSYLNFFAHF
jgi:structural maintenance of chromosome 2